MFSFPKVHLPPLIFAHSLFLSALGLRWIFHKAPTPKSATQDEASAMAGITTLAIGIAYLATSYMPIEDNQFLYASVPVRVLLALVAGLRILTIDNISEDGRNQMLFVLLYDGIGGLVCGWQLGTFNGRIPAYS
jgi:hypothetical protein